MKEIGKGDKTMKDVIKYIDWFLKEEGTTFRDKIEYEKAKSEAKGREDDKKETAKNLLDMNMPVANISKATGLSEQEINNLSKNIDKN